MTKEMYEDLLKRKQLQIDEYWELIEEQDKHIVELQERVGELEAQIEKMKCCQNCSHLCGLCELGIKGCYVCSKWELRR